MILASLSEVQWLVIAPQNVGHIMLSVPPLFGPDVSAGVSEILAFIVEAISTDMYPFIPNVQIPSANRVITRYVQSGLILDEVCRIGFHDTLPFFRKTVDSISSKSFTVFVYLSDLLLCCIHLSTESTLSTHFSDEKMC